MKPTSISIIITARNYAEYLGEAIKSCLNQTVPCEVIYSDDFSTDKSVAIANSLGVKVVEHNKHVGVVKARNNGFDASSGEAVVFMDGDDVLPKNFIEKHLEVFDRNTPYVYAAAQAFGTFNCFWDVHPWGVLDLWNRNFVNTNAMRWRDTFIKAGKWQETSQNTMWDLHLALREQRLGKPRKSDAVLMYRQHDHSWSAGKEKTDMQLITFTNEIRKDLATVSVGLVYGGRIPGFFETMWLPSLLEDIKVLKNKPELIIYNNSSEDLSVHLKEYENRFTTIKIINHPEKIEFQTEIERRNKVCELLANAYNMIMENATGDMIHLREDDVMPPKSGFKEMFEFIITGARIKDAVALPYFNRNKNYHRLIGGYFDQQNIKHTADLVKLPNPRNPFKIDFTGTGCILFWKHRCPAIFKPYLQGIQAHDWAWGYDHKVRGGEIWMLPRHICKHYQDHINYV